MSSHDEAIDTPSTTMSNANKPIVDARTVVLCRVFTLSIIPLATRSRPLDHHVDSNSIDHYYPKPLLEDTTSVEATKPLNLDKYPTTSLYSPLDIFVAKTTSGDSIVSFK